MSNGFPGAFLSATDRRAFPPSSVGSQFDIRRHVAPNFFGWQRVFGTDSNRFCWYFGMDSGFGDFLWNFDGDSTPGHAQIVTVGNSPWSINYRDHGPLVTLPLHVDLSNVGQELVVHEIIYLGSER